MQLYTDSLIRKGLVLFEESEGKKRYRLTEKGRQIMQQYLSIKEDLDIISEKHR
jgi:predicted transcriptional regulator